MSRDRNTSGVVPIGSSDASEVVKLPSARHKSLRTRATCRHVNSISDQLKSFSLFRECTPGFLEVISANLEARSFSPGEEIITQGDVGDCMYLLKLGEVDVLVDDCKVASLPSGTMFGEMAVLSTHALATKRTASIRATAMCLCYTIDRPQLLRVLSAFPKDSLILSTVASQRMSDLLDKGVLCTKKTERLWKPEHRQGSKEQPAAPAIGKHWSKIRTAVLKLDMNDLARQTSQSDDTDLRKNDKVVDDSPLGCTLPSLPGLPSAEDKTSSGRRHSAKIKSAILDLILSDADRPTKRKTCKPASWSVGETASVRQVRQDAIAFLAERGQHYSHM